jgi:hypothetical protein
MLLGADLHVLGFDDVDAGAVRAHFATIGNHPNPKGGGWYAPPAASALAAGAAELAVLGTVPFSL